MIWLLLLLWPSFLAWSLTLTLSEIISSTHLGMRKVLVNHFEEENMVVCRSEGYMSKRNVCLWLYSGGDQKLGKAIRCSHDPQRQNRRRADRGELQGVRIFFIFSSYSLYRHFYNFIEAILISFVFMYIWIDTETYNINIGYWQHHKNKPFYAWAIIMRSLCQVVSKVK